MDFFWIILIIFLYSVQTLFQTYYTKSYPGREDLATSVFCVLQSIFIILITACFKGFRFHFSPETILIGALNAAFLFSYNCSLMKASTKGSYAFMNVMMIAGDILVPMVYLIFCGITPVWYQYIAIGTMLLSFLLMNLEDMKLKGSPIIYYVMCVLLFLSNGLYGTMLKVQEQNNVSENKEMLIVTYAIMGVIAAVQLATKEKSAFFNGFKLLNKKSTFWLLLCLTSAALAVNGMVMIIARVNNTAVLFSLLNGGVLLVSALYSITLFKEKLSLIKMSGILLAAASIVVLSLPT